ncbi:MAG TPA: vitamin K epoxide reductase family protein [Verrucomicrobiae bacterium]|nr:vitamin K epoxide reductase family protein [Verrucomicrobiae bacterium]
MARKSKKNNPQTQQNTPARKPATPALLMARLCFTAAIATAAWLLFYTLTQKPMAGCGPGSPCDRVMGSSWAYWLDVPVSAPALAVYIALLICSIAVTSHRTARAQRAWLFGLALSITVVAVASWFVYVQLAVIKSVCKYCSAAHALSFIGAILFLTKAPRPAALPAPRFIVFAVLGLLPFAALVAGQELAPHKMNVVTLYKGTLKFDLREAPIVGNPDAKAFVVDLFDYTCPDCNEMHRLLAKARERLNNSFSIISIPCPLDANCNPQIKRTSPKHTNACEFARIGMAMRRVGSSTFEQYQDWFFTQPSIPKLDAARAQAESMAGKDALEKALADPWVAQMISRGTALYAQNGRDTKNFRIPQLIVGDTINFGPVRNLDDLINLLENHLPKSAPM